MSKLPPCYKCKGRYPACHDTCEKYKEWHRQLEAEEHKNHYDYVIQEYMNSKKKR